MRLPARERVKLVRSLQCVDAAVEAIDEDESVAETLRCLAVLRIFCRYFDYFDLLCGKRDSIDFKHWQTVVLFVQVSVQVIRMNAVITGKGVMMSFV